MTVGQRLRAEREARQMSIGDIARRTFIQPKFLQAIDDDNLAAVPESHIRLFVREYAKVVGIDPEIVLQLLGAYAPPVAAPVIEAPIPPRTAAAPPAARTFDASDDVGVPRGGRMAAGDEPRRTSPMPRESGPGMAGRLGLARGSFSGGGLVNWLVGGGIVLLLAVGAYYLIFRDSGRKTAPAAAAPPDGGAPAVDQPTGGTSSPTAILPRDTNAAPASAASSNGDSLMLEGRASGPVWFTVSIDGKRTETGTLDSGGTKAWHAAKLFKVSLGNAGGLSLTLNGKSIGTLGPRASAVRNKLIDSSGVRPASAPAFISPVRRYPSAAPRQHRGRTSHQPPPLMRDISPTDIKRPHVP